MKTATRILVVLSGVLILIQFFQPVRNQSGQVANADFTKVYQVPLGVQSVLKNACYDCHSNQTKYPFYTYIQPIGWMMAKHIKEGKEKLNFSKFADYTSRNQISKLNGIANQIRDDEMPLSSYKLIHKSARLSDQDKKMVINWMEDKADSLMSN